MRYVVTRVTTEEVLLNIDNDELPDDALIDAADDSSDWVIVDTQYEVRSFE